MILILGNSNDLAESVVGEIRRISDHQVAFFKADKCLEGEAMGFSYQGGDWRLFADIDGEEVDLTRADSVWYWKPLLPKKLRVAEQSDFISRQFMTLWWSVTSILKDKKWVNDFQKALEAERKPHQLKVAIETGFDVPATLITSDPKRAEEFWAYCKGEMIIKPLRIVPREDRVIYANIFKKKMLDEISRLKSSPVILQERVRSGYELRITMVGDKIFPAKINRKSEVDWRRDYVDAEATQLPANVQNKCFEFMRNLGLQYGCIDMAVTDAGEYKFFEINPSGQWKFIENKTSMPIGKAIAHLLV